MKKKRKEKKERGGRRRRSRRVLRGEEIDRLGVKLLDNRGSVILIDANRDSSRERSATIRSAGCCFPLTIFVLAERFRPSDPTRRVANRLPMMYIRRRIFGKLELAGRKGKGGGEEKKKKAKKGRDGGRKESETRSSRRGRTCAGGSPFSLDGKR